MRPVERWSLRLGFGLAAATGLAYGWLRYWGVVEGEFGPEPSHWQPFWQHAHVLLAPAFVFALGVGARGHVSAMLHHQVRRGRASGLLLAAGAVPLVLGGYALQVATATGVRAALGWTHAALGALFIAVFLGHWAKPRLSRRSVEPFVALAGVRSRLRRSRFGRVSPTSGGSEA
jgi:hypothetical protein